MVHNRLYTQKIIPKFIKLYVLVALGYTPTAKKAFVASHRILYSLFDKFISLASYGFVFSYISENIIPKFLRLHAYCIRLHPVSPLCTLL